MQKSTLVKSTLNVKYFSWMKTLNGVMCFAETIQISIYIQKQITPECMSHCVKYVMYTYFSVSCWQCRMKPISFRWKMYRELFTQETASGWFYRWTIHKCNNIIICFSRIKIVTTQPHIWLQKYLFYILSQV